MNNRNQNEYYNNRRPYNQQNNQRQQYGNQQRYNNINNNNNYRNNQNQRNNNYQNNNRNMQQNNGNQFRQQNQRYNQHNYHNLQQIQQQQQQQQQQQMILQYNSNQELLWLKSFLEKHLVESIDYTSGKLKKDPLKKEWTKLKIMNELSNIQTSLKHLNESLSTLSSENIDKMNEFNFELDKVEKNLNEISDPKILEIVKDKIKQSLKKKMWKKKREKILKAERAVARALKQKREKDIDEYYTQMRKEELEEMKKKEELAKKKKEEEEENKMKEKRKNFEMLIMKMIELRDIRRQKQNMTNVPYKDTNEFFLLKQNYYTYLKEKEMKDEKERLAKLDRKQQQQQPMNRLRRQLDTISVEDPVAYYYQAEKDINDLIKIRREWDEYIVPEGTVGSSKVPWAFVEPPIPSNYIWESYLLAEPKDVVNEVEKDGGSVKKNIDNEENK